MLISRPIFKLFLFSPILNLDNHRNKIQDIYLNLLYLEHSASFHVTVEIRYVINYFNKQKAHSLNNYPTSILLQFLLYYFVKSKPAGVVWLKFSSKCLGRYFSYK